MDHGWVTSMDLQIRSFVPKFSGAVLLWLFRSLASVFQFQFSEGHLYLATHNRQLHSIGKHDAFGNRIAVSTNVPGAHILFCNMLSRDDNAKVSTWLYLRLQ